MLIIQLKKKKTDYDTKDQKLKVNIITMSDYDKFTSQTLDAKINKKIIG